MRNITKQQRSIAESICRHVGLPLGALLLALAAIACGPAVSPTPAPITPSPQPTPVVQPSPQPTVSSPATATPGSSGPATTPSPTTGTGGPGGDIPYLDNRSSAELLIESYVNAINRKEYVRAYSYWDDPDSNPAVLPYPQFEQGYADTASVDLTIGTVFGDAGAGQLYYAVPAALEATKTDGTTQTFVGCYTLHLSQPAIQAVPPFRPLAIESARVNEIPNGSDITAQLGSVCEGQGQPLPATPTPAPTDIGASRYLDDRSSAVETLRSMYNALNRKEYVRAYSYWREPGTSPQVPPFEQFRDGYANTQSVDLTTGNVTTGAAAGNLYFRVPVTLEANQTDGTVQTFVGCYTLHLGQPAIQGAPPFKPLAIESATIQQVQNDTNTASQMATACPNQ